MVGSGKSIRLSKAVKEFNVGMTTIVDFLANKGIEISTNPNTKLSPEMYDLLGQEFQAEKTVKEEAEKIGLDYSDHETISIDDKVSTKKKVDFDEEFDEVFIKEISIKKDKEVEPVPEDVPKSVEKSVETTTEKEIVEEAVEKPTETVKAKKKEKKEIPVDKKPEKKETEEKDQPKIEEETEQETKPKVVGKIDLGKINMKTKPVRKTSTEKKKEKEEKGKKVAEKTKKVTEEKTAEEVVKKKVAEKEPDKIQDKEPVTDKPEQDNFIKAKIEKLKGPKILDKIELPPKKKKFEKKPVASSKDADQISRKKRRKRIRKKPEQVDSKSKSKTQDDKPRQQRFKDKRTRKDRERPEISEEDIQKQIKETLAKLTGGGKSKAAKYRKEKRQTVSEQKQKELDKIEEEKNIIKVTEFVTANELASMMDVQVNEIISTCMSLGLFVSINQRLDAETLTLVAEEFGYQVEFVSADFQDAVIEEEEDDVEDLESRSPIVTVMGHVDHGKTKLLDFIRKANVVAGEAGGITQHIGAYEFAFEGDKRITFLDTPGHEAFTAMRARGAKVTDVAIIVIAADDNVMPQTKEAINHAQAAGVPIVFAINKIDKSNANPEKIKEELSKMNILVEDWGGKFQSQEISAKQGVNIDELLEKVLLEAEMLDLKANPDKMAHGTVIESSLDKGRGYVAKLLVQDGTMKIGDIVIAGSTFGRVKAMYNERNQRVNIAGPSTPLLLLGLNGAPQAGDGFNILKDEKEAKAIANKRLQLQREQGLRTQKHITLDEIGRRIAIGDFKELNIIVKGDVDGSIEALADSLLKLSNEQIQVNIIHKSVGAVSETDVMLASASDAIIVAFQVRPSVGARKLAEQEQIDIRLYSIIYQAIDEIKSAMEGMLSPDIEEKIVCNVEIREVFKITKVGSVAGCMVLDGVITRNTRVRVIRDGIVVYTGSLGSLKRFKDDVKEVKTGYECGLNIENFNDIKVGDIVEGYEEVEVKKKL
ncbi:MAG: translation initiation factor IF-2 [Bacteroidales bacterium]|nr:translation initiation factor IF-2 [Bacteroidales bacterium]